MSTMKLTPLTQQVLAITGIILVALILINALNISYPVRVTNTTTSSELSVVGQGEVEVVPDSATIDVGISVIGSDTVEAAQNQLNSANNAIIAAMEALGVEKKDIKTANYSVYPEYDYENQREITGYNGDARITISTKDTSQVSQIVEAATKAGANNIYGTTFSVDDPAKYREEARNQAIANAREQANKIGKSLGINVGRVTNIVESSPTDVYPMPYAAKMDSAVGLGGGAPANIEAGTQTISSTVTLYFEKSPALFAWPF